MVQTFIYALGTLYHDVCDKEGISDMIGGTMMTSSSIEEPSTSVDDFYQVKFDKICNVQRFIEQSEDTTFYFYRSGVHMYTIIKVIT